MSTTREIRPVDMQQVVEYLRENLKLDITTTSEYVGDMHGGESLYQDRHTLKLTLGDEVISEVYL